MQREISPPVAIVLVGLSLPAQPFLDGMTVRLYFVPQSRVVRSQPLLLTPLQLCWRPVASTAVTMCSTSGKLSFQATDTTPVWQSTLGMKVFRGQGAGRKHTQTV